MTIDIGKLLIWLACANAIASVLSLGLHWLAKPLAVWIPPENVRFWSFFGKLEATIGMLALAVRQLGGKVERTTGKQLPSVVTGSLTKE